LLADHPLLVLKEFFSVQNHCSVFKQPIVLRFVFGQQTIRQNHRHDGVLNELSPGIAGKMGRQGDALL